MHGHPHPGKPRHHTAPSRLRKRDVPAVWDLFALDDRANASARDDDDASSVASLSHPPSIASLGSFASEDTQQSDSFHHNGPPMLSSGGSWPRIRKQRTSEMGGSMSLFEVAEALGADEISADADLASLAKLVAEEEQEMASSSAPVEGEATNVSIESFVDAVFKGITPGSSSSAQSQAASSTAATSTAEHPPAAPKPSSRPHTANELALLEALKQDQAAQEALKGGGGGGGGNLTNPGPPRKNTSSPTFAALDESAETFLDENAEAADDMFAMLEALGAPGHSSPDANPQGIPQHPSGSDAHASRADPYAYPHGPPPSFAEYDFGEGVGMPPLRPQGGPVGGGAGASAASHPQSYTTRPTPHHPHYDEAYPGWYEPLHPGGPLHHGHPTAMSKNASAPVFGSHDHDDVHLPASVSAEQLAGHLDHALGVPLDALEKQIGEAAAASRANTVRAQQNRRKQGQAGSNQRPPAKFIHQPPPPGYPAGLAPPPPPHQYPPPHHGYSQHPHHSPPLPPYQTGPPPTAHLDAEALANIPTAPIQPLNAAHPHAGMPMANAHAHHPGGHHPGHHPMVGPHHQQLASMQGVVMPHGYPHSSQQQQHAAMQQQQHNQPMASAAGRNGAERKEWTVHEDEIIRQSVLANGCRWRRIAAQLPGRSDDAVRNRWNRLKEMGIGESAPQIPGGGGSSSTAEGMDITDSDGMAASAPFALPLPDGMAPMPLPLPDAKPLQGASNKQAAPAPKSVSSAGGADGSGGGGAPSSASKETQSRVSWTKNEDETILRGVSELGHKWNKIAERLPGRTDHAIRNRFHRLQTLLEDRQRQQQRVLAPNMPLPLPPMGPSHHHMPPHAQALSLPDPHGLVTTIGGVHALLQQSIDGLPTPQSAASGESGGYETPVGSSTSPTTKA